MSYRTAALPTAALFRCDLATEAYVEFMVRHHRREFDIMSLEVELMRLASERPDWIQQLPDGRWRVVGDYKEGLS